MGKNTRMVFIIVFTFLVLTPFVFGANVFETLFNNPAIKGLDIAKIYGANFAFIDAILYFILFIGVASTALGERFKESKTVPTIIGVILAIGMAVFEYNSKFNLGKLAPFAALIFFLIFGMAVYSYTKSFSSSKILPFALAMVTLITLINWLAPDVKEWIDENPTLSVIWIIASIVAWIALILLVISFIRNKANTSVSTPSSSENADISTTFPSIQPFKKRAETAEKAVEDAAKDDKPETDIIKEEEQLQNASDYTSLLNAEGVKFATQLEELKKKEMDGEQKEKEMLNAINQYTNGINSVLSQITDATILDESRKTYIENHIKGIVEICNQIINTEKTSNQNHLNTIRQMSDDVSKIDDAVEKIGHIQKGLKDVENKILQDINDGLFKKIRKEMKDKNGQLTKNNNKIQSEGLSEDVRNELNHVISTLDVQKLTDEEILKNMEPIRVSIDQFIKSFDNAIADTKTTLNNVKTAKKKVEDNYSKVKDSIKEHEGALKKMTAASAELEKSLKSSKNRPDVEQIPIDTTIGVAKVFEGLINSKQLTRKFYQEIILPMIKDVRTLEANTAALEQPIAAIQANITKVQLAYTRLIEIYAKSILGENANIQKKMLGIKKVDTTKQIASLVTYVEKIVNSEKGLREKMSVQTIDSLNKSEASITDMTSKIVTEIEDIKNKELLVIGKLRAALNLILKHKTRANESFKQEADKFRQQMTEATQQINQSRSNVV